MQILKEISKKLGIDGAIGYTVLSRIISATGGLITLMFIALFLSTEEQGYYYTFGSIIAIQVFFELGLNSIITQYAAHEVAHLQWKTQIELSGDLKHLSRLSSLLHFCVKVFTPVAFILFVILEIAGCIFFYRYQHGTDNISWQFPWMLVAFSTSLMFLVNPVLAFIEGLGKVKEVAKLRFFQQLFNVSAIALSLIFGGKLWALGIASLGSFVILTSCILFSYRKSLLAFIFKARYQWQISYLKEIFPYQWKIALSWASGYFIFQLFPPVLFATEGTVVAGQMGMTLTALNGISSLSMSWMTTKIPIYSCHIASRDFKKLDQIFSQTIKQLFGVNLFLVIMFVSFVYLQNLLNIRLASRFLSLQPLILISLVTITNQFIFSWATYLRCHKKEPLLTNSVVTGILCSLSTLLFSRYFGLMGITVGYATISIFISFPWAYFTFNSKKSIWHGKITNRCYNDLQS